MIIPSVVQSTVDQRPCTPPTQSPLNSSRPPTPRRDTLQSATDEINLLGKGAEQVTPPQQRTQGLFERMLRNLCLGFIANRLFGAAIPAPVEKESDGTVSETDSSETDSADSIVIEDFYVTVYTCIRALCYTQKSRPKDDAEYSQEERLLCSIVQTMVASHSDPVKSNEEIAIEAIKDFKKATMSHYKKNEFPSCIHNAVKNGVKDPFVILRQHNLADLCRKWEIELPSE